jgi:glucose dehydrogenase
VASAADGLGQAGSFVDSPPLGTTYFYAAFVEDAEDRPSAVKCVSATPFDRTVGKVEWVYDTAISALTTPGLRLDVPLSQSVVYSVANDGVVHAIRGGSVAGGGGAWPSGWAPFRIGGSAQSRPPVVSLPPSSRRAVILGSQDGHAYAVDALTGELIWKSFRLGTTIQAAPAVALSALGGVKDLVFIGTRDPGQPNRLYALNAADGTVAWFFDNGGVLPIGIIVSGPTVDYG